MSENKYSTSKLEEFKKMITPELEETQERIERLQSMRKRRKEHFADANVDSSEEGQHAQQQSKNKASMRRLKSKAKALKSALIRIENGTYGIDERTGELIDENRLKAKPTATRGI